MYLEAFRRRTQIWSVLTVFVMHTPTHLKIKYLHLSVVYDMKIQVCSFFVFHFMLLYFFPNQCPDSLGKKLKYHEMKNEITTWVFVFQKYSKFWSISLEHFIKHKPRISEEWNTAKVLFYQRFSNSFFSSKKGPDLSKIITAK